MLYFAYDGTIHGDWLSHYAVRLALHHAEQQLTLIHVDDGNVSQEALADRLHLLEDRCALVSIGLDVRVVPLRRSVTNTLTDLIPADQGTLLVCGTRRRHISQGYLSGTTAERLMALQRFPVLAVRVVNPGLLGHPRKLLLPVVRDDTPLANGLPFLRLLAPDLDELHLLQVAEVSRFGFRAMAQSQWQHLYRKALEPARRDEQWLREQLDLGDVTVDSRVVVTDDGPKEIIIAANHLKSQLIFIGAFSRNLAGRFLYGDPLEQVLRNAPCDVAIYKGVA
jgi:nucleotide-binding universal stress UspA family protein